MKILFVSLFFSMSAFAWWSPGRTIKEQYNTPWDVSRGLGNFPDVAERFNTLLLSHEEKPTISKLATEVTLFYWESEANCKDPAVRFFRKEKATGELYFGKNKDNPAFSFVQEHTLPSVDCKNGKTSTKKISFQIQKK